MLYRRLLAIPFDAKFSEDAGNIDYFMEDKLAEDKELGIATYLSCYFYYKALKAKKYTKTQSMKDLEHTLRIESNSVLQWIDSQNITAEKYEGYLYSAIYDDYCEWCNNNGYQFYKKTSNNFSNIVLSELKMEKRHSKTGNRYYKIKS